MRRITMVTVRGDTASDVNVNEIDDLIQRFIGNVNYIFDESIPLGLETRYAEFGQSMQEELKTGDKLFSNAV